MKQYKKIIFDIDDTLLPWKKEYWETLENALSKYDIEFNDELITNIIKSINRTVNEEVKFSGHAVLNAINIDNNLSLKKDVIIEWVNQLSHLSYIELETVETLKYLDEKYQLYALTNFFTKSQVNRLENAEVLKYFTSVCGIDNVKAKPSSEAFDLVVTGDSEDYLIVGDRIETDITGGNNYGIDTCWLNKNGAINESNITPTYEIKSISELMTLL